MSQQKTGKVTVELDGGPLTSKPGAALQVGGPVREGEMSDQDEFIFMERTEVSRIRATLMHVTATDLTALRAFRGTVGFRTDTGQNYIVNDGVFAEMGELENGEVEVTYIGAPAVLA